MRANVRRVLVIYKPDKTTNFHDREEIKLYVRAEVFFYKALPICLLSKNQAKRIEKHFCGIKECQCKSGIAIQLDDEGIIWGIRVESCEDSYPTLLDVLLSSKGVIWGDKLRIIERFFATEAGGICSFWNEKHRAMLPIIGRIISSRKKQELAYVLDCPKFIIEEGRKKGIRACRIDGLSIGKTNCNGCEFFIPLDKCT